MSALTTPNPLKLLTTAVLDRLNNILSCFKKTHFVLYFYENIGIVGNNTISLKWYISESGFNGQVSLHKQGILLGKVALSVLTQNIHHNTKTTQTVQRSKKS